MSSTAPFDVSAELAALKHEKKNHSLRRLPPNATIQRRPLNHPPVADPHAGAQVPKVVYVSTRTPIMSAVKRVKKMLRYIEKRALQSAGISMGSKDIRKKIKQASEGLAMEKEEVLVKASGRAMEQALRVGEWFRSKEKEILCNVEIRTGSVSVVDDIVEMDPEQNGEEREDKEDVGQEESKIECGDTTLELMGGVATSSGEQAQPNENQDVEGQQKEEGMDLDHEITPLKGRKRKKKRKRLMYEEDELPEARIRWVKTVEVAISLQG